MNIIDQGIIFLGTKGGREAKCCFPSLVQLSNGEIISSFQASSEKNSIDSHVLLSRSPDGGKSWGKPYSPFLNEINGKKAIIHAAYLAEVQPGRLIAALQWCDHFNNPSLEFFNSDTGGLLPMSICLSESADNGLTWTTPEKLDAGELNEIPIPLMGPVCKVKSGTLICPFETSKNYDDIESWLHKAAYFISYDGGKTWPEYKVVAHDPQSKILYWDHRIANLGNGRLVDMFWAYDNVLNKEINAHMSKTIDGGQTWTQPEDTGLVGQPWPIPINEQSFVIVKVDRNISQTIEVVLTDNFGQSWDATPPLVIYSDKEQQLFNSSDLNEHLVDMGSWAYGLPSGIKLLDGNVLITYYAGSDVTVDIHWCLIGI